MNSRMLFTSIVWLYLSWLFQAISVAKRHASFFIQVLATQTDAVRTAAITSEVLAAVCGDGTPDADCI